MRITNLFLGCGAMKSGTTWLYSVLNHHPDIFFSYEKELHYFAHCHTSKIRLTATRRIARMKQALLHIDPSRSTAAAVQKRLKWYSGYLDEPTDDSWYLNCFALQQEQKYSADFSTLHCFLEKEGWDHAKALSDNLKVLYIICDPIERLWSHIRFHLQYTGRTAEFVSWTKSDYYKFAQQPFIWSNGKYTDAVKRLMGSLTPGQLKIAFFEDIHQNRRDWLRTLEDFLEINHHSYPDNILNKRVNESPDARMPDFFSELFADYAKTESESMEQLGLIAGTRWRCGGNEIRYRGRRPLDPKPDNNSDS